MRKQKGDAEITGVLIITLLISAVICVGGYFGDKHSCHEKTFSFEDTKHGLFIGCMVKHKGKWLPLDNIRGFD